MTQGRQLKLLTELHAFYDVVLNNVGTLGSLSSYVVSCITCEALEEVGVGTESRTGEVVHCKSKYNILGNEVKVLFSLLVVKVVILEGIEVIEDSLGKSGCPQLHELKSNVYVVRLGCLLGKHHTETVVLADFLTVCIVRLRIGYPVDLNLLGILCIAVYLGIHGSGHDCRTVVQTEMLFLVTGGCLRAAAVVYRVTYACDELPRFKSLGLEPVVDKRRFVSVSINVNTGEPFVDYQI